MLCLKHLNGKVILDRRLTLKLFVSSLIRPLPVYQEADAWSPSTGRHRQAAGLRATGRPGLPDVKSFVDRTFAKAGHGQSRASRTAGEAHGLNRPTHLPFGAVPRHLSGMASCGVLGSRVCGCPVRSRSTALPGGALDRQPATDPAGERPASGVRSPSGRAGLIMRPGSMLSRSISPGGFFGESTSSRTPRATAVYRRAGCGSIRADPTNLGPEATPENASALSDRGAIGGCPQAQWASVWPWHGRGSSPHGKMPDVVWSLWSERWQKLSDSTGEGERQGSPLRRYLSRTVTRSGCAAGWCKPTPQM